MTTSADQLADQLQCVFPALPRALLLDVLEGHKNSLEASIESLLVLAGDGTLDNQARQGAAPAKGSARAAGRGQAQQPKRPTWGAMGLASDIQVKLRLAPSYVQATPSHTAALLCAPSAAEPSWARGGGPLRAVRAAAAAGAQTVHTAPTQEQQQQQRPRRQQGQPQNSLVAEEGREQWQEVVMEHFASQHPWAGRELVGTLLAAVAYDLEAAEAILADMAAAPGESCLSASAAGSAGGGEASSCCSGWGGGRAGDANASCSSSEEDADEAAWGSDSCVGARASSMDAAARRGHDGDDDYDDFVLQGAAFSQQQQQQQQQQQPVFKSSRAAPVGAGQRGPGGRPQAAPGEPAPVAHQRREVLPGGTTAFPPQQDPFINSGGNAGGNGGNPRSSGPSPVSTDDIYWKHRGEAQRLTREWQRLVKKAAAAYGSGNRARAQRLAAEAQRVRAESLAAHGAAAARIEAELNAGGSLFELDLHGLHTSEAVAALERRLDLLGSVLQDAALQPQGGPAAGSGVGGGLRSSKGGGSSGEGGVGWQQGQQEGVHGLRGRERAGAGVMRPPSNISAGPAAPAAAVVMAPPAGGRWVLRVIVGWGAHSSGGEASIPRAVESRLLELGYKYVKRTGALDVQLKRPFAATSAAPRLGASRQ